MNNDKRPDIEGLLPWYVTGQLSEEECQLVEQSLTDNEELQQEVTYLKALNSKIKDLDKTTAPSELGLKRLMRDINKEQMQPSSNKSWWKSVVSVAAVVTIVIQAGVISHLATQEPTTQLLSGQTTDRTVLQIVFTPETNIAAVHTLLKNINANIIKGPSALGVYHLRLANSSEDGIRAAINMLANNNAIISVNRQE